MRARRALRKRGNIDGGAPRRNKPRPRGYGDGCAAPACSARIQRVIFTGFRTRVHTQ